MENETCFTIPDGFLIIHREQTVDIATAEKWLCTKRQRKYTSALRVGDSAILKKDFIKCPYCGRETPTYVRFLSDSLKWIPWWQRPKVTTISKSAIREWASPQYSLMCSTTLELNPIYFPVEGFTCPRCGAESEAGQVSLSVRLRREKKQLSVSCGPLFLDELLTLGKEIIVKKEELSFPFTESIVFNFSNGHVFFQITDANGALAAIYDITDFNREWAGTALHKVLTSTIWYQTGTGRRPASLWRRPLPLWPPPFQPSFSPGSPPLFANRGHLTGDKEPSAVALAFFYIGKVPGLPGQLLGLGDGALRTLVVSGEPAISVIHIEVRHHCSSLGKYPPVE